MKLHPAQQKIVQSRKRFRVVCCGRRFGKTFMSIEEIIGQALSKESRIAYIAPTYRQARDIAWEMLKKRVAPIIIDANEARLEIKVKTKDGKGESLIMLRGWESIETLRGQSLDFVVIDEIAMMRNWEIGWQQVIRPCLTDRKGHALFISTPKGFNHFHDLYNMQGAHKDYESFHFTTLDNPHIEPSEVADAKAELTESSFAQEYMADFRKQEGLVYKEFDRSWHVYDQPISKNPDDYVEIIVGIDWGYTNPAAMVKIYKDRENTFWVDFEYYETGKTVEELVEYAGTLHGNKYYPDPAEPQKLDALRRAGLNVRDVNKDITKGIDSVRALFKNNKLMISHECPHLIWELETYAYPTKRPNNNEAEKPIKENDHLLDALRYALYMQEPAKKKKSSGTFYPHMRK